MAEISQDISRTPLLLAGDYVDGDFFALCYAALQDPSLDLVVMVEGRHILDDEGERDVRASKEEHHNSVARLAGSLIIAAEAADMDLELVKNRLHIFRGLEMDDERTSGLTNVIAKEMHVDVESVYDPDDRRARLGRTALAGSIGGYNDLVRYVNTNHNGKLLPVLGGGPATSLVRLLEDLNVEFGPLIFQGGFELVDITRFAKVAFNTDADPEAAALLLLLYPGERRWITSRYTRDRQTSIGTIKEMTDRGFNPEVIEIVRRHRVGTSLKLGIDPEKRRSALHDVHLLSGLHEAQGDDGPHQYSPLVVERAFRNLLEYFGGQISEATVRRIQNWLNKPTDLPLNLVVASQDPAKHHMFIDRYLGRKKIHPKA